MLKPSFTLEFYMLKPIRLTCSLGSSCHFLALCLSHKFFTSLHYVYLINFSLHADLITISLLLWEKGEPAAMMTEYGFKYALSIDEYASCFENIDPLAPYKKWTTKLAATLNAKFNESVPRNDVFSKRVQAAFVVSDPVDWSRDIQVTQIL
ncbi:hypothetical protein AAZV13_15G041350 [Glycine max]